MSCSHEESTYKRFLEHVFEAAGPVNSDNEPFKPKFLMADFERAISASVLGLGMHTRFCLFHFIQVLIRLMDEKQFAHLTSDQREAMVGRHTDESKRASIAYRMHFAETELAFNTAVEEIRAVSEELHSTMISRWVGANNSQARKYFRAFMDEDTRNAHPEVRDM